jgi:hypothetical protein
MEVKLYSKHYAESMFYDSKLFQCFSHFSVTEEHLTVASFYEDRKPALLGVTAGTQGCTTVKEGLQMEHTVVKQ